MSKRIGILLGLGLLAALALQPSVYSADAPPAAIVPPGKLPEAQDSGTYQRDILPFLQKHCYDCHGNGKSKGDMSLEKFKDDLSVIGDRKRWDDIQHMLETGEMPPEKRPRPPVGDVDKELEAIRGLFERFDRNSKPNVGRVTMRRLNKTEYNNTIRDLVGIDFKPADDFPADDVGYGFDNIGDVLSVTPLLLEKYLSAAEQVLEQAIVVMDPPKPSRSQIGAIRANFATTKTELGGTMSVDEGDYIIRARVSGDQVGDEPVKVALRVGGVDVKEFDVTSRRGQPMIIESKVRMKPGTRRVAVAFLNPYTAPLETQPTTEPTSQPTTQPNGRGRQGQRQGQQIPAFDGRTRMLQLQNIELDGPYDPPPPERPEVYKRLMAHDDGLAPRDAARQIITRFAAKAYRRPLRDGEVDQSLAMYDLMDKKGARFELCMRAALYRVLVSPHFLFRIELDPAGASEGTSYQISEYELASRLSYFVWNSTPDDELLDLAGKGQLRTNLQAQLDRMIKDPKSGSFLRGFAEQWLALRKIELSSPDPKLFPDFNTSLRDAMVQESELFFETMVRENHSILDLIDADFTFVNEQLAKHYGIEGVKGKKFVRVKLPPNRAGILTQASILTLTSNATRTSPVKRGKFILEQILNTPPPPPPPDVPALDEQKQLTGTLRQVMEQHRANPMCASCHARMDPIGFAFEHFDATGAWRDKEGENEIDSSGTLPDGRAFNGPDGLDKILRTKKDLFVRCVAEKMLTYATGRGLEYYDRRAVDKIMAALKQDDYRFSTLLAEIVKSDPFQMRTATGETP
ncbi:MAG TPA: DUF1592 domain-containing protein [Humisphaera sp.]|jgi:hypothetical protein|nr:DUF1592 domain-containing protein [Humisphaera sp.]